MMKRALFILWCLCGFLARAQQSQPSQPVLNEKSIIRGEDGLVYPYAVWKKMTASGNYAIKNRKTFDELGRPEFVLVELNEQQKADRLDRLPKPRTSASFVEGEMFAGFKAADMDGNKFDLRNPGDKVYVLNFWFINCPPCRSEIPHLNTLVETYKDNPNVVFLAVCLDTRYEIKNFLKTTPFNYHIIDDGKYLTNRLNVSLYPTHVIIDKTGKIKFSSVSFASNSLHWMKKTINEALTAN